MNPMLLEANESQYFIGIGLPKKENAFFSQLKMQLSGVDELSSPPHITIKPPFFHANEKYLVERLTAFAKTQEPFTVKFDKVGSFLHKKSATVYLAPDKGSELKMLERSVSEALPFLPAEATFVPHLTIAQRISHDAVPDVKNTVRDFQLELKLEVSSIVLYRKKGNAHWEAYQVLPFEMV